MWAGQEDIFYLRAAPDAGADNDVSLEKISGFYDKSIGIEAVWFDASK